MRAAILVGLIVLCQGVGVMGARWTAPEIRTWYRGLRKPRFNPPAWVFGPVWTVLYTLMAVAAWMMTVAPGSGSRTAGLVLFAVQLGLNLGWPWIFFRLHAPGTALAELIVLWAAIAATTALFWRVDEAAAWLMLPYLGWTAFAAVLNGAIRRLN